MVTVTMATIVQEATCPLVSVFLFVVLSSPTERPVRREKRGAVTDGWRRKISYWINPASFTAQLPTSQTSLLWLEYNLDHSLLSWFRSLDSQPLVMQVRSIPFLGTNQLSFSCVLTLKWPALCGIKRPDLQLMGVIPVNMGMKIWSRRNHCWVGPMLGVT